MRTIILMSFILLTTVLSCYGQSNTGKAAGIEIDENSEEYFDDTIKYCYIANGDRDLLYDTNIKLKSFYKGDTVSWFEIEIKNRKYHFTVDKYIEGTDYDLIYTTDKNVWMKGLEEKMILHLYDKELLLTNTKIEN